MLDANLMNLVMVISLSVLAFFSLCFFVVLIPIALQLNRTLNSMQHLLDTVNEEIEPTVKEVKQSIDGVKNIVQKSTVVAKDAVSEAGILVVSSAYGVLAGIKDYLVSCKNVETSYNNKKRLK